METDLQFLSLFSKGWSGMCKILPNNVCYHRVQALAQLVTREQESWTVFLQDF
jgi:hypothetical protein